MYSNSKLKIQNSICFQLNVIPLSLSFLKAVVC